MIPEQHLDTVIPSGIAFMRAITEAYGSEQGLQLWNTITDVLDPDVKAKIFFALITGEYHHQVRVTKADTTDKVAVIKAFRTVDRRRLGLKEAKDMADRLWSHPPQAITLEVDPEQRDAAVRELRRVGCRC